MKQMAFLARDSI